MNKINTGFFALLILASFGAGADSKYPAADFQPEVVYQDKDLINKNSGSVKAPDSVKAVRLEPKDTVVDSKYPAADFKPQVIFHDEKYVPSKVTPSSKHTSAQVEVGVTNDAGVEKQTNNKTQSTTTNYLIGLFALVAAGFFLFKNQGKCTHKTKTKTKNEKAVAKTYSKHPSGLTGVAKYVNRVSGTGVSRYIDKNVKTAKTGVAKYVAKKAISSKAKNTEAVTGVEKYISNKG